MQVNDQDGESGGLAVGGGTVGGFSWKPGEYFGEAFKTSLNTDRRQTSFTHMIRDVLYINIQL